VAAGSAAMPMPTFPFARLGQFRAKGVRQ
jgi:hypothetical protein